MTPEALEFWRCVENTLGDVEAVMTLVAQGRLPLRDSRPVRYTSKMLSHNMGAAWAVAVCPI